MLEYLAYLGVGLVTRYPKVYLHDALLVFDLTELMIYLSALKLGLWQAVSLIILLNWLPQFYTKVEGPTDALIRTISTTFGLLIFYLLGLLEVSTVIQLVAPSLVSTLLWSGLSFFVFSIKNPMMFLAALGQATLYYRVSEWYLSMTS